MTRPLHRRSVVVRVAYVLFHEVGEGKVFAPEALFSEHFPERRWYDVERRMRDLRANGWVIDSARTDHSIEPGHCRLTTVGVHVWEDGQVPVYNSGSGLVTRAEIAALDLPGMADQDLAVLVDWMEAGERPVTTLDEAWDLFRKAKPARQQELRQRVLAEVGARARKR